MCFQLGLDSVLQDIFHLNVLMSPNFLVYGEDYTNFEDLKTGQPGEDKTDNSKKSKEDNLKNNLSTPGKKAGHWKLYVLKTNTLQSKPLYA